jgi:hypothetical protein
LRIILEDGSLARYPQGGGHWSVLLQYAFGLRELGHDVIWLELLRSSGNPATDERLIHRFFRRFRHYGVGDRCALLCFDGAQLLESARAYGLSIQEVRELARSVDLMWNFACGVRQPLLSLFTHPVLVDLDPGHLQVSALTSDLDIPAHRAFLTVGTKMHHAECEVPTLGLTWKPFLPFVYLPWWRLTPDPGERAPFTSVTHWTWDELWWQERVLSVSKRDAYLRYLGLPERATRAFELAVNFHPDDPSGDRDLLRRHGWNLVHPYQVAGSPPAYRRYIRQWAEFSCPKPIHRELRTGWFSDRSAAYLASGRPVLSEDTGFAEALPTGNGLLTFRTVDEAVAAESYLDSRRSLDAMLTASQS